MGIWKWKYLNCINLLIVAELVKVKMWGEDYLTFSMECFKIIYYPQTKLFESFDY